jgi:hypothetical protein
VYKKLFAGLGTLALAAFAAGCSDNANTNTANTNAANSNIVATSTTNSMSGAPASSEVVTAPDNSEVRTEMVNGVETKTRTFKDPNSRVERVVVSTRNGKRTARVYYRDRTVKELPDNEVERALDATGSALVSAGGKAVDVTKEVGSEVGDKAEDAYGKTKDVGKTVGREVGDKAEDVGGATVNGAKAAGRGAKAVGAEAADKAEDIGGATVNGAKKAGSATVKGAKKAGSAIKNAVTP